MAQQHVLCFHRPRVPFPEPTSGSFQPPVTPASEDLMASSGQQVLHSWVYNNIHIRVNSKVKSIINNTGECMAKVFLSDIKQF